MAVLANQRVLVRRPGVLTAPYGLFTVTRAMGTLIDQMPQGAGQGGINYQTGVCELPTGYETNCLEALDDKGIGDPTTTITGDPFVVLTQLSCGSVGMDQQLLTEMMRERRLAGEQSIVENIFSTGDFGAAESLSNNTPAAVNAGAGANVVEAISNLEDALYGGTTAYGLTGVLHVPYLAAAFLSQAHVIWRDNAGIWRTAAGTPVVIGNYAGTGPAGEAPAAGTTYLYITGQVSIWRTPESSIFEPQLSMVLDRSTNQVNAQSEREYIVTFECASFYSLTTLVVV